MADILIFGAHPDDIEFGMGGTVLTLAKEYKVVNVVLSRGEMGTHGTPEIREKEMKEAAKYAKVGLEILDFKDCEIYDNHESRLKIAEVIRKYKPKLVFAPYHTNIYAHKDGAAHSDHKTTGMIVREALRLAKFKKLKMEFSEHNVQSIVYYMTPKFVKPTFINDITPVFDRWIELIKKHKTQMALRDSKIIDILTVTRKYNGVQIGAEYAEAFIVDEPLKMNLNYLFEMS
jgi:N-acetylglucosamine malate deacetylase 1